METKTALDLIRANTALTKSNMKSFTDQIESELLEIGTPVDTFVNLHFLEQVIKDLKNRLLEDAIDEVSKGIDTIKGAKITVKEGGVKYDYSNCSDLWNDLKSREDEIKEVRVAHEKRLKYLDKITQELTDDGEVVELKPPIKTSKTTLNILFPKD